MPNQENIRKWAEALRSGDYEQTQCCLHNSQGFCCLGVAADVSGVGHWSIPDGAEQEFEDYYSHASHHTVLTPGVCNWLGVRQDSPKVSTDTVSAVLKKWRRPVPSWIGDYEEISLTELNDRSDGVPFEIIADIVEAEFLDEHVQEDMAVRRDASTFLQ